MINPETITFLEVANGKSAAKTLGPGGVVVRGYDAGWLFAAAVESVDGIRELGSLLAEAADYGAPGSGDNQFLVVRGEPIVPLNRPVRRKGANFAERPRCWMMLDFDKVAIQGSDLVNAPEEAVQAVIEQCLPENFQDVTCFWQLSSRAGFAGDLVKVHIWFWLSRPVGNAEGKAWSKEFAPDNDASLFRRVQPHFVANPLFVGCPDPLPRRVGWIEGESDVVDFPEGIVEYEEKVEVEHEEYSGGRGLLFQLLRMRDDIIREQGEPGVFVVRCPREAEHTGGETGDTSTVLYPPSQGGDLGAIHCFHGHCQDLTPAQWLACFSEEEIEDAKALERPSLARDNLERFAKRLANKADDKQAELGAALLKVCKGEIYADPGERQIFTDRLVKTLAKRYPDYEADSLAKHFSQSLQLMRLAAPEGCPTVEDITGRIAQDQTILRKEMKIQADVKKARTKEAFKGGREDPYTPDEIESFGPDIGKRWILQCGKSFYLFFNGSYNGPYTEADVRNVAVRDLAPAPIDIHTYDKAGNPLFKTLPKLVEDYGTVADHVIVDLREQKTIYDEHNRTIIEAARPLRNIQPVYHEEIDNWLFLLGGEHYEKLKTWIAAVTELDKICCALFLIGKKGVGKSLLALGLSRLWTTTGPTPLQLAFASFNDSLVSCPLTFADEALPKDFRGSAKNAELRLHIQALERPFMRKYLPNSKLLGATRTIVAANSKEVLRTAENLSNDDIEAITDRYFPIYVDPDAGEYLRSVSTKGWVDDDMIAEHALWLRDNHEWGPDGRFLINVVDEQLQRSLMTQSGCKSLICQWLCNYLIDPQKFHRDPRSNLFVRVREGRLLVNVQGMVLGWKQYMSDHENHPPMGILSRSLSELCNNARPKYFDKKGVRTNYRVIEMKNLIAWAEETGFADAERLEAVLSVDTEEKDIRLAN